MSAEIALPKAFLEVDVALLLVCLAGLDSSNTLKDNGEVEAAIEEAVEIVLDSLFKVLEAWPVDPVDWQGVWDILPDMTGLVAGVNDQRVPALNLLALVRQAGQKGPQPLNSHVESEIGRGREVECKGERGVENGEKKKKEGESGGHSRTQMGTGSKRK